MSILGTGETGGAGETCHFGVAPISDVPQLRAG